MAQAEIHRALAREGFEDKGPEGDQFSEWFGREVISTGLETLVWMIPW